jgi:hypothetical protein
MAPQDVASRISPFACKARVGHVFFITRMFAIPSSQRGSDEILMISHRNMVDWVGFEKSKRVLGRNLYEYYEY